jgi:hypothetical protein
MPGSLRMLDRHAAFKLTGKLFPAMIAPIRHAQLSDCEQTARDWEAKPKIDTDVCDPN